MEIIDHTAERTVVTMPVEGNRQTAGLLHGGASAALAETAASWAAQVHARAVAQAVGAGVIDEGGAGGRAVGVDVSITHLRAARDGVVTARATAIHLGRSSTVHVVDITGSDGTLLSNARVTNRVLVNAPDAPSSH